MESKRLDLFFRFKREDFDLWSAGPDIMVIKINSTWGQGTSFSYFYMMELERFSSMRKCSRLWTKGSSWMLVIAGIKVKLEALI